MDERFDQLAQRIRAIEERNRGVEADKAWEVSLTRRGFIGVLTYAVASAVLWSIGSERPMLDALIPTAGYLLSTLSIPFLKRWWIQSKKG